MKYGMLCLLLLSGCAPPYERPYSREYALAWICLSPEGCERTAEVERIDRLEIVVRSRACQFTSTQDEAFSADAQQILEDVLPTDCPSIRFLSLFGHELEPSELCYVPGGFELELSIPNQDPTTFSMWLVEGRELALL
jgi:hypothetical protein